MKDVIDLAEKHSQVAAQINLVGLEEARKHAHALLVLCCADALRAFCLPRLPGDALLVAVALGGYRMWRVCPRFGVGSSCNTWRA